MKVALTELFKSVQGEGYNAGRQAIFVRLAGCPLSCHFADGAVCDTPYMQAKIKTTVEELFRDIADRWGIPEDEGPLASRPMMIFTGGEPTAAPAFNELVRRAKSLGYYTAVETNGIRWREGLTWLNWRCVSPKEAISQGSPAKFHNKNPQDPTLSTSVKKLLAARSNNEYTYPSEYRYVITGPDAEEPPYRPAFRNYLSPAVLSDGSGLEWQSGFPGFVPGALERCLEIVERDSRWQLSTQNHKLWKVR